MCTCQYDLDQHQYPIANSIWETLLRSSCLSNGLITHYIESHTMVFVLVDPTAPFLSSYHQFVIAKSCIHKNIHKCSHQVSSGRINVCWNTRSCTGKGKHRKIFGNTMALASIFKMQYIYILQTLSISHAEFIAKVTEMSAKFCIVQTPKVVIRKLINCSNFCIPLWQCLKPFKQNLSTSKDECELMFHTRVYINKWHATYQWSMKLTGWQEH